ATRFPQNRDDAGDSRNPSGPQPDTEPCACFSRWAGHDRRRKRQRTHQHTAKAWHGGEVRRARHRVADEPQILRSVLVKTRREGRLIHSSHTNHSLTSRLDVTWRPDILYITKYA